MNNGIRKEYQTGYGVMVYSWRAFLLLTWSEVGVGWNYCASIIQSVVFASDEVQRILSLSLSWLFIVASSWTCV